MSFKVTRALVSVWDKRNLAAFAARLVACGVEIISTGGTAKHLRENGIEVREVSDVTGFPELFEGRVKTLHPKIHGGILYRRDSKEHAKQAGNRYQNSSSPIVHKCKLNSATVSKLRRKSFFLKTDCALRAAPPRKRADAIGGDDLIVRPQ